MNHYQILIKKEMLEEDKEKFGSGNPAPVHVKAKDFETVEDLETASNTLLKKIINQQLTYDVDLNERYEYNSTEQVLLIKNYDKQNPVYEGKANLPKDLRKNKVIA